MPVTAKIFFSMQQCNLCSTLLRTWTFVSLVIPFLPYPAEMVVTETSFPEIEQCDSDVVFAIPVSDSIDESQYELTKDFVIGVADKLRSTNSRIGVFQYGDTVAPSIKLNSGVNATVQDRMKKRMETMKKEDARITKTGEIPTFFGLGLGQVRLQAFSLVNSDRRDTVKIVIGLVDGPTNEERVLGATMSLGNHPELQSAAYNDFGFLLFSVLINRQAKGKEIAKKNGYSGHFFAPYFNQLVDLQDMVATAVKARCWQMRQIRGESVTDRLVGEVFKSDDTIHTKWLCGQVGDGGIPYCSESAEYLKRPKLYRKPLPDKYSSGNNKEFVACEDGGRYCTAPTECDELLNSCTKCVSGAEKHGNSCKYKYEIPCVEGGMFCTDEFAACSEMLCRCIGRRIMYKDACTDKSKVPCNPSYKGNKCEHSDQICDIAKGFNCVCRDSESHLMQSGVCKAKTSIACSQGGTKCKPKSVCEPRKKKCQCVGGYQLVDTECKPYSEIKCGNGKGMNCDHIRNSYCRYGECTCGGRSILYKGICKLDEYVPCLAGGKRCFKYAGCYVDENGKRECTCRKYHQKSGNKCKASRRISCTDNAVCASLPESECISNKCTCRKGWVMIEGECRGVEDLPCQKEYQGGTNCGHQPNSKCENHECVCVTGYTLSAEGKCDVYSKVPCELGGTYCVQNSECKEKKCKCKEGFLHEQTTGLCEALSDVSCVRGGTYCEKHSTCVENACKCDDGYLDIGGECRGSVDVECEKGGTMCHDSLGVCEKHKYESARCVCPEGYYLLDNAVCKVNVMLWKPLNEFIDTKDMQGDRSSGGIGIWIGVAVGIILTLGLLLSVAKIATKQCEEADEDDDDDDDDDDNNNDDS